MTDNLETQSPLRIVVLISGSGTNLQALIDAQPSFRTRASIVLVLSNRKAAYGLTRAKEAGIPTAYLALQPYLKSNPGKSRDDYDAEVARMVLKARPDLVVLAGWMHVLGDGFLDLISRPPSETEESAESIPTTHVFPIPAINLHPALPGAFDGTHAIDRAWEAYKAGTLDHTGVMVHRVVRQVDAGEPILVREIPFREDETKEQFEERLHGVEWEVIVEATNKILTERLEQCTVRQS
ncbi:SubName: Full=Related to glycinamide ribonucleotide transformylase {ECO:0000313/EMBL:CCA74431.1} [Serendipita indica DSM 11827]|uniref:Phosphoribosylglycinamide formyltransferase n=1 Tax=Serendipita indica (strain DSM 11827) TaxID=1109443 RepID=G4TSY8_SERID|nr:SubName: Full=Related to glycinamide ribonucleotide transformylase {ECO:0000313/EMBL:CCA74431.1} [Serendipita indica DSM 11827]CCA74431.1 related to glycinamide ribonucleotide transformylase [Serendipita indica DSM 11827]